MFITFLVYQTQKSSYFSVLRITSPTEIVVDLNKNGVEDDNEAILINNLQSFSTKQSKTQSELAKKLNISEEEALGLGFFAENFAREFLDSKKVTIVESSNQKNIIVNNKNYKNLILDRGLALENGKLNQKAFQQNLKKVRELKFVIFNNKSHKYHKLNCKYGLIAHNSQILPLSQIPTDAKPCKFCLVRHKISPKYQKHIQKINYWNEDEIPNIKSPPTAFQAGAIKIFLTDMTRVLKPTNSCGSKLCNALVDEINSAQHTIDFAIYGYSNVPKVQSAIESAKKRGVKIRFVYDYSPTENKIYPATKYLAEMITDNNHDSSPHLMHNKFFIFDKKTVLTGSANLSNTDMSGFNSNVVVLVNSEKFADIYSQEFEQMYNGHFQKKKKKIYDKTNEYLSIYFSPKDKGIREIVSIVDSSQKYVYMPAFLLTHKELADSLINAHKRGVAVKVILDATSTHVGASKMKILRQNGIPVKTENFAGKLHSKSLIIDDLYTIIGSMNFSKSGETDNDENLIIVKNKEIAIFYKTFFQYLWARIPDKWLKYNARAESLDSIGSCSDGIDNDFDGKIDNSDDSCKFLSIKRKK